MCVLNFAKDPRPKDASGGQSLMSLQWEQVSKAGMCADATAGLGQEIYLWVGPLQDGKTISTDNPASELQDLSLFVNEVEIKDVPLYWVGGSGDHAVLRIPLTRTANNKTAWDQLLGEQKRKHSVRVSVGLTDRRPFPSTGRFNLAVMHFGITFWVFLVALLILGGVVCTNGRANQMLRESGSVIDGKKAAYSLSRVQMVYWFTIVIVSYVFIWLITGDRDTVNDSVLAIIGISAGTFLGAISIDASKKSQAQAQLPQAIATLADSTATVAQIAAVNPALAAATSQVVVDQTNNLAKLRARGLADRNESFLTDILTDENGLSFHRFQIVAWSAVLGIIFISCVWQNLGMPTFSNNLLGLLGISSGTYLGFKFPEQKTV
jgi:hypothetical protein